MADGFDLAGLKALVAEMRTLGVLQAYGVVIGPEPPRVVQLERAVETAPPEERPELTIELERLRREERIQAAREEMRETLAATGRVYSDEAIDTFLDPSVLQ